MRILAAMVLALFAAGAVAQNAKKEDAAAGKVYKWTDENGTVHFSPKPPESNQAEEVKLRAAPPAPPVAAETKGEQTRAEQNAQRCKQHEANLKLLQEQPTLSIEENGEKRIMTSEERDQQIRIARAALEQCKAENVPVSGS